MIEVKNAVMRFDDKNALDGVSLGGLRIRSAGF